MNSRKINMLLSLVCVLLVLVLSTSSMLVAKNDDDSKYGNERCKLQGTWIMDSGPVKWMMTFNGTGDNEGTVVGEFVGPTLPDTHMTSSRGVWAKTGPQTYDWTIQVYLVDGSGSVITTVLNEATVTFIGCNTAEIYGEARYFGPGADEPYLSFPFLLEMQRLLLHQPSPVQIQ